MIKKQPVYCKECGHENNAKSRYCIECGREITKTKSHVISEKGNYYLEETTKVVDLKHFPFSTFNEFTQAVKTGVVTDTGIAMDIARKLVMETQSATSFQRNSRLVLTLLPFALPVFYLICAIVLSNFWFILYALLPIIIMFTGSPIARKVIPVHYVILGSFVLIWAFTGSLSAIYWLPIVIQYWSLDYMYKGSTNIVRQMLTENEKILCFLWKWNHLSIFLSDGRRLTQIFVETNGKMDYYSDIENDWKEYIERKK